MPDTAGPIAAPAIAVATCDIVTSQKFCEIRIRPDAVTVQIPGMITQSFLCLVASTNAPAGVVISMPATPPTVITVPISPLCQPCASKKTPRNGPIPACMSAMKKLSDKSGQSRFGASLFEAWVTFRSSLFQGGIRPPTSCSRSLEFRYQRDSGDHERSAGDTACTKFMDLHAEHSETVDHQRHQDVRGDRQPGERTGADRADEQQSRDDRERTDEAPERRPPRHLRQPTFARQRMRKAHHQTGQKGNDRQKRDEARQPWILQRNAQRVVHWRPPRLKRTCNKDDRIEPGRTDILHLAIFLLEIGAIAQFSLTIFFRSCWARVGFPADAVPAMHRCCRRRCPSA